MADRPLIFDLSPAELTELLLAQGMPRFRATQVLEWVYRKHVADPQAMSNLPKAQRDLLASMLRFTSGRVVRHQSATDGVQKLLLEWDAAARSGSGAEGAL